MKMANIIFVVVCLVKLIPVCAVATFAAIQEGIATKLMKQAHISAGDEEE